LVGYIGPVKQVTKRVKESCIAYIFMR